MNDTALVLGSQVSDVVFDVARRIGTSPDVVNDAVTAAATTAPVKKTLLAHLARERDALHSGASNAPTSLGRLVEQLRLRGVNGLRGPGCAACGREMELKYRVEDGRMCLRCFRHYTARPCARCGKTAPVATRTPDGQPICGTCYIVKVVCSVCQRPGRVVTRTAGGQPICPRCAPRPEQTCSVCGRQAPIHSTKGAGSLCDRCYTRPARQCGICGEVKPITRRGDETQVDACDRCYARPIPPCPDCGQRQDCGHDLPLPTELASNSDSSSAARIRRLRALRSRHAPERECALCNQFTKVHANWPRGGVCRPCYTRQSLAPSRCTSCGRDAVLIGVHDGEPCCGPCSGSKLDYRCRACGQPGMAYKNGMCTRCVLQDRLTKTLGPPSDTNVLEALRSWLTEDTSPKAAITWLARPGRTPMLHDLSKRPELGHHNLDEFPRTAGLDYLRALLVNLGILPRRNEPLERTVGWLNGRLQRAPTPQRHLVRPFGEWVLLRRARRSDRQAKFSQGSARYLRSRGTAAFHFLDWLDGRGILLSGLTQHDVDRYLAEGRTTRYLVRDFLVWTSKTRESPPVHVPERRQLSAVEPFDEDARAHHIQAVLGSGELDLAARVAAVFVLLYGQHLSRVVTWRTDRITEHPNRIGFRFDQVEVALVEPFGTMVRELAPHSSSAASSADHISDWIFPGGLPGRHVSPGHLALRLAEHGIQLRRARNSALAELAADLPAAVLADLLGMHIHTAVAWTKSMQRDWSGFVAATYESGSLRE